MSSINTKRLLAQSLKTLTEHKNLKNITIVEICNQANLNRHTFYYHFKDKQDLVNWIYKDEIIKELSKITADKHWSVGTLIILNGLKSSKSFYINALKTEGQNSFKECLFLETLNNFRDVINKILNTRKIKTNKLDFIARFYAYSFTYMTIEWIMDDMKDSPEELMNSFIVITENGIADSVEKLIEEQLN